MQHAVKTLKIILGQSNTLLVVLKEEESLMCTHDEQIYIPYSNVKTFSWSIPLLLKDSSGPPMHL